MGGVRVVEAMDRHSPNLVQCFSDGMGLSGLGLCRSVLVDQLRILTRDEKGDRIMIGIDKDELFALDEDEQHWMLDLVGVSV